MSNITALIIDERHSQAFEHAGACILTSQSQRPFEHAGARILTSQSQRPEDLSYAWTVAETITVIGFLH